MGIKYWLLPSRPFLHTQRKIDYQGRAGGWAEEPKTLKPWLPEVEKDSRVENAPRKRDDRGGRNSHH